MLIIRLKGTLERYNILGFLLFVYLFRLSYSNNEVLCLGCRRAVGSMYAFALLTAVGAYQTSRN